MIRSTVGKVMWAGRATVFLVGLAVILALLFGAASTVLAHSNADNKLFHLGHGNSASKPTALVSTLADAAKSALTINNKSGGPALDLKVQAGQPPMKVNSTEMVAKLHAANADKLDGQDSADFAPYPIFAKVSGDGTLGEGGSHVVSSNRTSTGEYSVIFDRDVSSCVHIAQPVGTLAFALPSSGLEYRDGLASEVRVHQADRAGNLVDGRFSLAVFCK